MPKPDAYIETRHWPSKGGRPEPTLIVTYDALKEILEEESAVIDPNDVPGLLEAIGDRVKDHRGGEKEAVGRWADRAAADIAALDEEVAE